MISPESINYSLRNIKHRKTRSALTILSIFIGITAIFIFVSFGWGLYNYVNDLSSSSSADKLMIMSKGSAVPGLESTFALTDDDVKAVEKSTGVFGASGIYIKTAEVQQNKIKKYTYIIGYDPEKPLVMDVFDVSIDEGRELRPHENGKVVLGYNYQLEDKIFPKGYRVNDEIEIQGQKLKIVGFYESVGNPQDDSQIYVTQGTIDELYPNTNNSYGWIVAKVDLNNIDRTIENVEKNLRKERGLEEGKEDFFVQSFDDMIEAYSGALDVVIGFVILIAFISVIVSAVNTANTMITSVLERVKEIGVIKSIGARNSEVLKIFLFESGFLGFIAGIVGVVIGFIATSIAKIVLVNLGYGFLSPYYSPYLFVGCIVFATLTGAISGVIPAIRASKINPVDALRYE